MVYDSTCVFQCSRSALFPFPTKKPEDVLELKKKILLGFKSACRVHRKFKIEIIKP